VHFGFFDNRMDKQSCSVWLTSVVSSAGIEKYLHWEIPESICFCMALPIKDIIWFCTLHLKYEALQGAFEKRSDVCLSAAYTRSFKAALKTPSLQSVSFCENTPASLWSLNGISWRPQNSIVLMIWKDDFDFPRQPSADCCLKHFVHLWICWHLSAQSYWTWLHIIYDSEFWWLL